MKKIKTILKILLGFIFMNLFSYYFIISEYNQFLNWEEIKKIKTEINDTSELPENIYKIISEINGMRNLNSHFISTNLGYKSDSPALLTAYTSYSNIGMPLPYGFYKIQEAMVYERYFSNKQLLSYYINQFDFLYGQIGIKNAAQFYFNESLENLDEKEIKTLALMLVNPSLYNPRKNSERLEIALDKL